MNDLTGLFFLWALVATGFIILIWYWCPYVFRIMFARRLVWICHTDGTFEPVPAKLEGLAYKTKKNGIFEFEKEDVFYFGNKPSIIVYSPYSKALRPKIIPVLMRLKMLGIDRYDMLQMILNSVEISPSEFARFMENLRREKLREKEKEVEDVAISSNS